MIPMPAKFIVFEGPDGAGTTLHSRLLVKRLENEGHKVLLTAEPTDGPIGKFIREKLKKPVGANSYTSLPANALQLLFTADRAWHLATVIEPALKDGKIVICDRYIPSTLIYGEALGLPIQWLKDLNKNFIQPDQLFFLLPLFEVCLERLSRRTERDSFEQEELQRRVYEGYERMAKQDSTIRIFDTAGDKEAVARTIHESLQRS